ncbi:MAG: hypothetical protein MJZ34_14560 [Paludibacteraceae bacterium]|nr:hypothetical protein [Paludibacteraceae bacterium]
MYDYSDRIKKFIEDRMKVTCEVSIDMCSMDNIVYKDYIVYIDCPFDYQFRVIITEESLAKCFSYEMQKVINNLRFEWQMLITKP